MKPSQALDVHSALTAQLANSKLADYLRHIGQQHIGDIRGDVATMLPRHLRLADTYHVGAEISSTLYGVAERYHETVRESEYPPPSNFGVMVLDEPMRLVEHRGRMQLAHIITWGLTMATDLGGDSRSSWLISLWNDANRAPDEITREMWEGDETADPEVYRRYMNAMTGGFYPIQLMLMHDQMRMGSFWVEVPARQRQKYREEGYKPARHVVSVGRLVLACWDLMSQTRGNVAEPDHVERASLRRARKQSLPARVQVVTLRRQAHGVEHPGTGTPLDHRVPVKEHTRHYWVRDPETGELRRERRKIAAHERGPKDAPLVVTEKVYSLRK